MNCPATKKISPSMYMPLQIYGPQTCSAKNPPLNCPSKYKPPGELYLEFALKYRIKQSKNGKFPSNYKASPINFEMQISLRRYAPPQISPSKRAFEKYKPRGLFLDFTVYLYLFVKTLTPEAPSNFCLRPYNMTLYTFVAPGNSPFSQVLPGAFHSAHTSHNLSQGCGVY